MKIAFRVDASLQMGSGHVMRCLTLADTLKQSAAECHFICREHPGHLIEQIRGKGHVVHALPYAPAVLTDCDGLSHAAWLGATQEQDVQVCQPILQTLQPDWLIVDHYALDSRWEERLRPFCRRLMAIDDLADRKHVCDLLLDQNLGRQAEDYGTLVGPSSVVLVGPDYALLRPEFAALREASLKARGTPRLRNILISMGGVDEPNATCQVLEAMTACELPVDAQLNVIMGAKAPWLHQVQEQARKIPWPTQVMVNVSGMAALMAGSDFSIGAAGSTSWERCCLGLPSIVLVLAENQRFISSSLDRFGASKTIRLDDKDDLAVQLGSFIEKCRITPKLLKDMSRNAASVCDGLGAQRIGRWLFGK